MKPGKGGNATGPPKLGRAIIGATLLLKGDAFTSSDQPQGEDHARETAQAAWIRLEMPTAKFAEVGRPAVSGVASRKTVPVRVPYAYAPPAPLPRFYPPQARPLIDLPLVGTAIQPVATTPTPPATKADAVPLVAAEPPAASDAERLPDAAPPVMPQPEFGAAAPPELPAPQFGEAAQPPAPTRVAEAAAEPVASPDTDPPPSAAEIATAKLASPPLHGPEANPPPPLAQPLPEPEPQVAEAPLAPAPASRSPAAKIEPMAESPPVPEPAQVVPTANIEPKQPAAAQSQPDLTPLAAPPPRALSDAQLAHVQAPALSGVGVVPTAVAGAGLTTAAAGSLPEPTFGKGIDPPLRAPTRLALAEIPPQAAALPKPEFGPVPAAEPPHELVRAAMPLPEFPPGTAAKPVSSQAGSSTGYADTSPRMPGAPAPNFTAEDELILQLQTQRGDMADTIIAYGTRSGVYLPLGAIARFLDLALSVSDNGNYASGWFIDEKQTLSLNLREGTLLVGGKALPLDKGDAAAFEGELYLHSDRFADLLPLSLSVDLRAQTVTVKTRVPFPFEQRVARDEERARLEGMNGREQKRWPREPTPWRALSFPLIDAELRAVTDRSLGTRAEGDMRLAGDFVFMTARLFAGASSRDGLTGARIELGRRDPDSDLLGPLKASEFQIGDVTTVALPLGLRGTSGRGAFITNAPLERASVFDTIDLYGDLPDGYEVELYRNNILIGSTRSPVNGQYQFFKVATDYGLNVFRLVFFGPQGQRREEVRQISVGDGRLSKGELVYTFGAAQKDTNVLGVRGPNFSPSLDFGAWRSSALVEYGLSRSVTASLGGAWYESRFGPRWMATGGLRTGLSGTALKLDLGYQSSGGKAVQVGLGGKLLGLGYTLTHGEYQGGFTDEVRSFTADPLRRATELNVNTTIKLGNDDRPVLLPVYGQLRRVEFADGRKQTDATAARFAAAQGPDAVEHLHLCRQFESGHRRDVPAPRQLRSGDIVGIAAACARRDRLWHLAQAAA